MTMALAFDWVEFTVAVLLSLGLLYATNRLFAAAIARWGKQWNIRSPGDWASLPVLALRVSLIVVALTPAINGLSQLRLGINPRHCS